MNQQNLKLGVDVAARELSIAERALQSSIFELAERFYTYVEQRIEGGKPVGSYGISSERIRAMMEHAYHPGGPTLSAFSDPKQRLKADVFLLTSSLAADMFKMAIDCLNMPEVLGAILNLTTAPLDENDVPEEAQRERLDIIGALAGLHNHQNYKRIVMERLAQIKLRDGLHSSSSGDTDLIYADLEAAFEEALGCGGP